MSRRKGDPRFIKNLRLRNVPDRVSKITYSKRRRGLLKKMVELTIMCGVQAKIEIQDRSGNFIVLEAGSEPPETEDIHQFRLIEFTEADVQLL